jgi:hypothetical protein
MPVSPYSRNDGIKTCEGQALTQRWQAVHVVVKCSMLPDPGGATGVVRTTTTVLSFVLMIFFVPTVVVPKALATSRHEL